VLELQLCRGALAVAAGSTESIEPLPWVKRMLELRDRMGDTVADPWRRRQIDWDVGEGLSDAITAAQIRGEALLSLDRVDDARRHYSAMSSSLSGDAETRTVGLLGLAACALARDNTATARSYFEQALLYPDRFYQAHALAGLVRVASEAGDLTTASRLLDQLRADYADREDAIASATEAMGR
jgi:hypothetical protein